MPPTNPTLQVDGKGVAWITFDDPERKVNVLSEQVLTRLGELLGEVRDLASRAEVRVAVLWSAKSGFIAGADVTAIEAVEDPVEGAEGSRFGQRILGSLNSLGVPAVAAIHGTCLGGGVEMSLACDHRIASDSPSTKMGLPEVLLGILPAWGGTTRLPRLVGVQASLDLLLSGRQVSSSTARRIGLVDDVVPADLFREKVAAFATAVGKSGRKRGARRSLLRRLMDGTLPGRRLILFMAKKRVMAQTGGHYPAPLKILEVVRRSASKSLEKALEIEAKAAGELVTSSVCKNLIHVFHLREEARKGTGVDDETVESGRVEYLAVLGAGVMGGGIGQLAAYRGVHVRMKDIRHDAVASGLEHARKLFTGLVKRRKLRRREADQRMTLISGSLGYEGFMRQDLVIEAVVEKMDIKRIVLRETEDAVRRDCVLATNTSSLSVNEMASALARPENFVGMHFFNPVHRMPLVEVVRGTRSSDHAVAVTYGLALKLGKVPVVTNDGPGFLVNRILGPYMNEAGFILTDGASVEAIDDAAKNFGMPMGPLRLVDEVGIDISRHAGQSLHEALGDRLSPSPPLVALAESGRLGKKGGIGFYRYESGKEKGPDPEIYAVLSQTVPPVRVDLEEYEIRGRLVLAMVNEAAR
ncbi:MAG: 3-hydroxyacyl-CoA dehydrogenase NAD-binding domain-containing protein, partial [Gemmatimonadota bacterium]|nr:3-hydroxyacyl-CoA dehydrogenase NAD-binding domain-containing protein [Gemmatimonadota bacterium]